MIEGLKPYAEYKESGLNWLSKIPSNWQTVRNGSLFSQRNETNYPQLPILEVSLRTGVRVRNFETSNRKQLMSDFSKYKRAVSGDIAYNMMRMWQGAVGVAPVDGLVSPAYVVARPFKNANAHYYRTQFRMDLYLGEIDGVSRGIVKDRNRLYWDQFKQMRSLAPPPEEQAAIVRFLDHANRKIDGFIRAKRKLIGLLNEQKQAIIHRAVTRGLDPNVPLKPSGIPWLGDIPKHWEVKRIRQIATMNPSKSESSEDIRRNSLVVFLPMEKVGTTGAIDASVRLPASTISSGLTYFRRGDVLVAKITPCFENGKGAFLNDIPTDFGFGSTEFHVLRPSRNLLGGFLRLVTSSKMFIANGENNMTGSAGQQRVPTDFVRNYPIVLPPIGDQQLILEELAKETVTISTAIARTEREISLMQEYRTRLTADIVTGKLDVRDAAAKLLDTEELGPTAEEVSMDDDDEQVNESN
jgi:type I restriction enzyme, S subunit